MSHQLRSFLLRSPNHKHETFDSTEETPPGTRWQINRSLMETWQRSHHIEIWIWNDQSPDQKSSEKSPPGLPRCWSRIERTAGVLVAQNLVIFLIFASGNVNDHDKSQLTSLPISVTSLVAAGCPLLPRNRRPRLQKLLNLRNFVLILRKSWRFFCWKSGGKSPFAGTSQSEEKSFLNLTKSWRIFLSKRLGKSRPRLHELLNLSFGIWDLHIYRGKGNFMSPFSCSDQLNRWPCHCSVTQGFYFYFWPTLETFREPKLKTAIYQTIVRISQ